MPTRDELALALKKADAAGAADDARKLAAAIREMDTAQPVQAPVVQPAPVASAPVVTKPAGPNSFAPLPPVGASYMAPQPEQSVRQAPSLDLPKRSGLESIERTIGQIASGEKPNQGSELLRTGMDKLGVKTDGRPNEQANIIGGLGDLVGAANYGVRDWWRNTGDKSKAEMLANMIVETSGAGTLGRVGDHIADKGGPQFLKDNTGLFDVDENYDPKTDLALQGLNAMSWSTRSGIGGLVNPRAPGMGAVKRAAADVATNFTMGGSDLAGAGVKGVGKLVGGFARKPGANLPPINQTAVPVTQPAPQAATGGAPPPIQPPVPTAPAANAAPPAGNLQPVGAPRPQAGPISTEYAGLDPKVRSAFNRLLENSGVEPQRIPAIIANLDQLSPDRAEMVVTELIRKFGAGDPKLQTNITSVAGDLAVNAPKAGGDNAQAIVKGNIRKYMDQEAPYIESVAEKNFGPGAVFTDKQIEENLQAMRGQYQKLLAPANRYGGKRSAANKAAIDQARTNLADYLKRTDTAQEIPDWLKRDTINTLNRDLREMGLPPIERNSAKQGFTWAELVDEYPTQIAHALQSTYAKASREADMAKFGDIKAGAFKRDLDELRGRSQKRANAANVADRGYGLLHLLEEAVPKYKELRVNFGTEHGSRTALTMPARFMSAVNDEVKFADLLDDLDELTPEQLATAENQITTLVRNAVRRKQETPTLAEIGAGERGVVLPNLQTLSQAPVLNGLEKAFGAKGKELADAIRLARAASDTAKEMEPKFGPRSANNMKNAESGANLYEDPFATDKNVIDNTTALLGTVGATQVFTQPLVAGGLLAAAGARAIWQKIKNGRKLTPEQRTQFAQFLFALRRGEHPELRIEGPDTPPQLPAPDVSTPPRKPEQAGFAPEAIGSGLGATAGLFSDPDTNHDGVVSDEERAAHGMGVVAGAFGGGLLGKGVRSGAGAIGKLLPNAKAGGPPELPLSKDQRIFAPGKPDDLGFITSAEHVLANPPPRFRDAKTLTADQWRNLMRDGGASKESFHWQIEPALKRLADEGFSGDIPKAKFEEALARSRGTLATPEKSKIVTRDNGREVEMPTETNYGQYVAPGSHTNYKQHVLILPQSQGQGYKSHNWKSENPVGHVRTTNRTSANGEKVLHVEELQSDLHQEGAQVGYKGDPGRPDPQAQFDQAMKRRNEAVRKYEDWYENQGYGDGVKPQYASAEFDDALEAANSIKDPTGRELFREAVAADKKYIEARKLGRTTQPPRAPLENWEEPFIRYALKQAADEGVDVVSFPTWNSLHIALKNEGTKKFYDQRLPRTLERVAKSLGLKVERANVTSPLEFRVGETPDGFVVERNNRKSGDWIQDEGFSDKVHSTRSAAAAEVARLSDTTTPAIRLTPQAKSRLSEGVIMDAKDPGRRAAKPQSEPVRQAPTKNVLPFEQRNAGAPPNDDITHTAHWDYTNPAGQRSSVQADFYDRKNGVLAIDVGWPSNVGDDLTNALVRRKNELNSKTKGFKVVDENYGKQAEASPDWAGSNSTEAQTIVKTVADRVIGLSNGKTPAVVVHTLDGYDNDLLLNLLKQGRKRNQTVLRTKDGGSSLAIVDSEWLAQNPKVMSREIWEAAGRPSEAGQWRSYIAPHADSLPQGKYKVKGYEGGPWHVFDEGGNRVSSPDQAFLSKGEAQEWLSKVTDRQPPLSNGFSLGGKGAKTIGGLGEKTPTIGMPRRMAEALNQAKLTPELREALNANAALPAGERLPPMDVAKSIGKAPELYAVIAPYLREGSELSDTVAREIGKLSDTANASPVDAGLRKLNAQLQVDKASEAVGAAKKTRAAARREHTNQVARNSLRPDAAEVNAPFKARRDESERAMVEAERIRDEAVNALNTHNLELLSVEQSRKAANDELQRITEAMGPRAPKIGGLPAYNPMSPKKIGMLAPKGKAGSAVESEEAFKLIFDRKGADILAKIQSGELVPKPFSVEHQILSYMARHPAQAMVGSAATLAGAAGYAAIAGDLEGKSQQRMIDNGLMRDPTLPEPEKPGAWNWEKQTQRPQFVETLQIDLQDLGYRINDDGRMYRKDGKETNTTKAIKHWQWTQDPTTEPTGILTEEQWYTMREQAQEARRTSPIGGRPQGTGSRQPMSLEQAR